MTPFGTQGWSIIYASQTERRNLLFQKNSKKDKDEAACSVTVALFKEGTLFSAVEDYIEQCYASQADGESKPKVKPKIRFPNVAGFCRYLGTGISDVLVFKTEYPFEYDRLLAIFEDEALNSDVSSTLLSAYMKKRLLYAVEDAPRSVLGEVRYCFEHDVFADGE